MLVLSRKASERILIGDNITIEIRRVAGNRVTLAVEAPRDVRILRGELEKVANEFVDPEPAHSATQEKPAEPYIVSHTRLMPPSNDASDPSVVAYAVS